MSWYYAENNERRGPVDNVAFDGLVRAGVIKPDTLVWQEGMPNWVAFAQAGYVPTSGMPSGSAPGEEMGVCSESGKILPRSELVEIEGRLVSAEYKNVVLQRIREGVSATGSGEDPESLAQIIEQRGWNISAGDVLSRGWKLVKSRFWLICGSTFLVYVVIAASGLIPLGQLVVQGPLMGGIFWLMLKVLRGQHAGVEDAFQGFQRGFGHLFGVSILTTILSFLCIVPGAALLGGGIASNPEGFSPLLAVGAVVMFIGALAMCYFIIAWVFALPLVVDKRFEFWPAMKLSRRVVSMHWWQIFWLLMLTGLVIMGLFLIVILAFVLVGILLSMVAGENAREAGFAVGSIGILAGICVFFALMPLGFSTLTVAYEQIFSEKR